MIGAILTIFMTEDLRRSAAEKEVAAAEGRLIVESSEVTGVVETESQVKDANINKSAQGDDPNADEQSQSLL